MVLALIVWQRPNLLLLDEPTNHLDLDMRQALTEALMDYEGSLVVVSHDRHLLRNTVSEFYLVHDKKVEAFDGDLEDYQKWLLTLESDANQQMVTSETNKENEFLQRKEQKRREAELREKTAPIRKALQQLEKSMLQYSTTLAQIETKLSDNDLYLTENKEKLTTLLADQAELKKKLEQVENDWLTQQELLESFS